jgi:ABC-2 type transport system permease protein
MRTLYVVIKKEFLQLIRNPLLLFILVACPVVILGLLPYSVPERSVFRIVCVDEDDSSHSRSIVQTLAQSLSRVRLVEMRSLDAAFREMENNRAVGMLRIPQGYEEQAIKGEAPPLSVAIDGTQPLSALNQFYYLTKALQSQSVSPEHFTFNVHPLFNETTHNRHHSIVSFLILLATLVGFCLITLNIVSEKEKGVFEQLHATTLRQLVYMAGKMVFFLILCLLETGIGLLLCRLIYDFRVAGSLGDLLALLSLFFLPMLGLGVLIASVSKTQTAAVYTLTFLLLVMILMSSMFSLLSSMPAWAQSMRYINPIYFALDGSRLIALKGFALKDIPEHALWLVAQGTVVFLLLSWGRVK